MSHFLAVHGYLQLAAKADVKQSVHNHLSAGCEISWYVVEEVRAAAHL